MSDLDAIRSRHHRYVLGMSGPDTGTALDKCEADRQEWPCDTAQVLAELDRQVFTRMLAPAASETPTAPEAGSLTVERLAKALAVVFRQKLGGKRGVVMGQRTNPEVDREWAAAILAALATPDRKPPA